MTAFEAFKAFSARLGSDPMQVQGAGGNTSFKDGPVMWIKASGTELANARNSDIFVAVSTEKARAEARDAGDGTCRAAVLDPSAHLRPSIETTFHALFDWTIVIHTHSVATLAHAISEEGCAVADDKLAGLPFARVPYAKPGLPLTKKIAARIGPETQIVLLENHGLICAGSSVDETADLTAEVERRLALPALHDPWTPCGAPPEGYVWSETSWMAQDKGTAERACSGSYYPDHVVFLGPGLPREATSDAPAILIEGEGVAIRKDATASQKAMLQCLSDVLARVPQDWSVRSIGADAEASLLDWDAEKYRQALAART